MNLITWYYLYAVVEKQNYPWRLEPISAEHVITTGPETHMIHMSLVFFSEATSLTLAHTALIKLGATFMCTVCCFYFPCRSEVSKNVLENVFFSSTLSTSNNTVWNVTFFDLQSTERNLFDSVVFWLTLLSPPARGKMRRFDLHHLF